MYTTLASTGRRYGTYSTENSKNWRKHGMFLKELCYHFQEGHIDTFSNRYLVLHTSVDQSRKDSLVSSKESEGVRKNHYDVC